jgi:two-component system, chemotaxis family, sensor kinase Cph1
MSDMISQIQLGDHAALFYHTRAEQLSIVIPFIAIGLERNERCMYIAEDNSIDLLCRKLQEAGVDVQKAQQKNALRVLTKHETYLKHGVFEPDKMIGDLCNEVQSSVDMGFTGLRAAGELSWALDLPSALMQIVEYEEELEEHFYSKFAALCQYDESRYPGHIIQKMKSLHPVTVCGGELIRKASKRGLNPTF